MKINKNFLQYTLTTSLILSLQACLFDKKKPTDDDDSENLACLIETEANTTCINYKSGFNKTSAEESCEDSSGVFQEEACSDENLVGTCEIAVTDAELEYDMLFYSLGTSGYDSSTAQTFCETLNDDPLYDAVFHPEDGR